MKKILIVLNRMDAGGITKSLCNLLSHLKKFKNNYEIDLFLFRKYGCYISDIPNYVNVIESKGTLKLFGASQKDTKKFGVCQYVKRFFVSCWTKIFTNYIPLTMAIKQNKLKKEYDAAISFAHTQNSHNMVAGSAEMVLWGVNAKKKMCFIHGDVLAENLLTKSNINKFAKFDNIFCVSKSCANQLKENCNRLADKCDFIYNTQDNDDIIKKSNEVEIKLNKDRLNLIMVSRLSKEKAHIRFLKVMKKLVDDGLYFNLHILGDGIMKQPINECIQDMNLGEYVKLYGAQSNPFAYVKQADLFVLPSYNEAAPMVYNESMLLGVPILTTNVISAYEMVGDKGFVCENTEDGIYVELKQILCNKNLIQEKKEKLKNFNYDNDSIVEKLLSFVE